MQLSETFSQLISPAAVEARSAMLREYGFDPLAAPTFWENWVAVAVAGETTSHKAGYDVVIKAWRDLLVEVKFSRPFLCDFANGRRRVFKWALSDAQNETRADVLLLIGCDLAAERVWCWALPGEARIGRSATVTYPADRIEGEGWSRFDLYEVPPMDLLPALLMAVAESTYDREHHAKNAAATRRARSPQLDLLNSNDR